jgi:hypothetical protein
MQELLDAEPPDATLRARIVSSLPDHQHAHTRERLQSLQGAVAALLAVAIVVGLVYVGRTMRQPQPVSPRAITITQSDSGCVYDGPDVLPAGTVTMQLKNQTTDYFYVHVLLLFDNHQYSELAAHIAAEQRRLRSGESTVGPPSYVGKVAKDEVPPQAALRFTATLPGGSYGVVCIQSKEGSTGALWAFRPIAPDGISVSGPITAVSASTSP